MKLKLLLGLVVLILLFGCTQPSDVVEKKGGDGKDVVVPKTSVVKEEYIVLGFSDALTGDAASYGQVSKAATEIAVEEINAKGGVNGKKLKVIYEDNRCDGKNAVSAATKLINVDKVKVILGYSCSGATLSAAPFHEKSKVILLAGYASSPVITNAGDYIFRTSYSDADSGEAAGKLLAGKFDKIAILSENTDFAQAYKKVTIETIKSLGKEVVADEVFLPETRDFRTAITKIIEANPDVVWVDPQTDVTGGNAVKQLKELGWEKPVYTNFAGGAPGFLELIGDAAEGIVYIADPEVDVSSTKWKNVLKKYKAKYNKDPAYSFPLATNYDNIYIIAKAIEEAGYNTDKIKEWLYNMPEFDGALGRYSFDEKGDMTGVLPVIKVIKDGKAVEYTG